VKLNFFFKKLQSIYWESEFYGRGKLLRKYGFYPKFLPLNLKVQHGIYLHDNILLTDLNHNGYLTFYYENKFTIQHNLKTHPRIKAFTTVDPYLFYLKRKSKLENQINASGTLFFWAHSDPNTDILNESAMFKTLLNFPEQLKPLTICLHPHDIVKGLDKTLTENGFITTCIGNYDDYNYISKFYKKLSQFEFVSSNEIGSYTFYAVNYGKPFFLYGIKPRYYNESDVNFILGEEFNDFIEKQPNYKLARELFYIDTLEKIIITENQKEFVNKILKSDSSISRLKFTFLLYQALFYLIVSFFKKKLKCIY
jgi:hypothetical protein